jgi:hypothetical protein
VGSHPEDWTNVGRPEKEGGPGPVGVSQRLNPGTYKVTGGSIYVTSTGKSLTLKTVNGASLPYTFTIGSSNLSVHLVYK